VFFFFALTFVSRPATIHQRRTKQHRHTRHLELLDIDDLLLFVSSFVRDVLWMSEVRIFRTRKIITNRSRIGTVWNTILNVRDLTTCRQDTTTNRVEAWPEYELADGLG
jgi:hypothetical protein